jgi:hypothetical protein
MHEYEWYEEEIIEEAECIVSDLYLEILDDEQEHRTNLQLIGGVALFGVLFIGAGAIDRTTQETAGTGLTMLSVGGIATVISGIGILTEQIRYKILRRRETN